MNRSREEMLALAERCETATGPDRELDALIEVALKCWPEGWSKDSFTVEAEFRVVNDRGRVGLRPLVGGAVDAVRWDAPNYTASLDAAMTLVPSKMCFECGDHEGGWARIIDGSVHGFFAAAETVPLALCAAALRTLARENDGG